MGGDWKATGLALLLATGCASPIGELSGADVPVNPEGSRCSIDVGGVDGDPYVVSGRLRFEDELASLVDPNCDLIAQLTLDAPNEASCQFCVTDVDSIDGEIGTSNALLVGEADGTVDTCSFTEMREDEMFRVRVLQSEEPTEFRLRKPVLNGRLRLGNGSATVSCDLAADFE